MSKMSTYIIHKISFWPSPKVLDDEKLVYKDGASKNGEHLDWIDQERDLKKDLAALKRHLKEYEKGITEDKDSGAHPLSHVRARCGIIIDSLPVLCKRCKGYGEVQCGAAVGDCSECKGTGE